MCENDSYLVQYIVSAASHNTTAMAATKSCCTCNIICYSQGFNTKFHLWCVHTCSVNQFRHKRNFPSLQLTDTHKHTLTLIYLDLCGHHQGFSLHSCESNTHTHILSSNELELTYTFPRLSHTHKQHTEGQRGRVQTYMNTTLLLFVECAYTQTSTHAMSDSHRRTLSLTLYYSDVLIIHTDTCYSQEAFVSVADFKGQLCDSVQAPAPLFNGPRPAKMTRRHISNTPFVH